MLFSYATLQQFPGLAIQDPTFSYTALNNRWDPYKQDMGNELCAYAYT